MLQRNIAIFLSDFVDLAINSQCYTLSISYGIPVELPLLYFAINYLSPNAQASHTLRPIQSFSIKEAYFRKVSFKITL